MTSLSISHIALTDAIKQFENYKKMAETAVSRINDDAFFRRSDSEANSIAIIMKHMAGNMRSRWRDFLTSDGEKQDRNRDTEFELDAESTRAQILALWENGWKMMFNTVRALSPKDLSAMVVIRGDQHVVIEAIMRQLTHYAYHVGQIVLLSRNEVGTDWDSLSTPRGQSDAVNARLWGPDTPGNPAQKSQ